LEPNFDKIVIGWSSSKIVSGDPALWPRWPPQCSCIVIESSFDPGERLQAPGSLLLGFIIDSVNMIVTLPQEKVDNVKVYIKKSKFH
jgi:hypothetical protein